MARKKMQSLEEGLKRIEEIVEALESGETTLEESIKLYKDGIETCEYCSNKLNDAEKQVLTLQKDLDGTFTTHNFTSEED